MNNPMADPASGVPQPLLFHLHLVSKNRYPTVASLSLDTVVDYLLQAPKIVRDVQPMQWTPLDAPVDGTLMLVWQPLAQMNTTFATDGYIWADPEQSFNTESRGYGVEMHIHRAGYRPPEQVATHCRKRYRLTPSRNPNTNAQQVDPALWIVHYSKAAPADQIRSNQIQVDARTNGLIQSRRMILGTGQLPIRKEFMLHDRNNWPIINFPQPQGQHPYPPNMYRPGYPPQGPVPPAVNQRRGQPPVGHNRAGSISQHDPMIDDEEDVSRGDFLDFLTPRDVSRARYKHNHEMMEEVFDSPLHVGKIVPVSLGLGRKGELENMTGGFFDMPLVDKNDEHGALPRVGQMEAGKAEEFEKRANAKLAQLRAQIGTMRRRHEKEMQELADTRFWKDAELRVRHAVFNPDPSNRTPESWRTKSSELSPEVLLSLDKKETVGDTIEAVEAKTGRQLVLQHNFDIKQNPGYQEPRVRSTPSGDGANDAFDMAMNYNNVDLVDTDMDMGNTAGSLLDQYKSSNTPTPAQMLTTPSANGQDSQHPSQSADNTPAAPLTENVTPLPITSYDGAVDEPDAAQDAVPQPSDMDIDVEMAGVSTEERQEGAPETSEEKATPEEWVMVENAQKSPETQLASAEDETGVESHSTEVPQAENEDTPGIFGDTPGGGLHGLTPAETGYTPAEHDTLVHEAVHTAGSTPGLDTTDQTAAFPSENDFGNIDDIGDELEGYRDQNEDLGLEGMDDSAFGDAFHVSETEGNGNGSGNGGHEHVDLS